MWNFLWHLRGATPVPARISDAQVLERVEKLLADQRKPVIPSRPTELRFESPLWDSPLGPNWLAMVIYDRGSFRIEHGAHGRRLRYDLRSLHGFVFCLGAAIIFFAAGVMNARLPGGVRYAAFAFTWLYGMNMVLAWARVPRAIRKAVSAE
ncbi:hypothetical protein [Sphingomonas crusticola]|uniref:hypothetical protein n=1 Tax=Sphingomonas crusticola TaxID=1697973 RepID=UPI000E258C5D|nr:hypothetical protein [Sphingomonas crusticola]